MTSLAMCVELEKQLECLSLMRVQIDLLGESVKRWDLFVSLDSNEEKRRQLIYLSSCCSRC